MLLNCMSKEVEIMANLLRHEPFAELAAMQRQLFGDDWLSPIKGVNLPTTDVYTDKKSLVVEVHLPHFNEKDVDVQLDEGSLVISAQRHEKEEDKDRKYVVRESSTSFYRRVQLPKGSSSENVEATLRDGVLRVIVPLTPLPEAKRISIKTMK